MLIDCGYIDEDASDDPRAVGEALIRVFHKLKPDPPPPRSTRTDAPRMAPPVAAILGASVRVERQSHRSLRVGGTRSSIGIKILHVRVKNGE